MRNFEIQKKNSESFRSLWISLFLFFVCFLFPTFTYASGITRAPNNLGLVGYWPMNEGSGTVSSDFSGNKNNGAFGGTPTWVSGKFGKGLNFFNLVHYVQVPDSNSLDTTSDVTVSAWIKLNGNSDTQFVVNKDENYSLSVTGGLVRMQFWTGTTARAVDVTAPSSGSWHHVVGVVTSNEVTAVYVDGILQGSSAYVISGGVSRVLTNPLIFGTGFGGGYAGSIDEVRIYNRALSQSEVSTLYKSGVVVKRQANNLGLVGYWPMNEGDGTVASDFSGNRNSSQLSGDTSWVSGKLGEAVYFNEGLAGLATIPSSKVFNFANDITVSAWVKTTVDGGIIFQLQNSNPLVYLQVGDTTAGGTAHKLVAYFRTDAGGVNVTSGVTNIDDGKWHFVAAVRNIVTQDVRLYVDGSLDGSPNTYADTAAINTFGGVTNYISSTGPYGFTGAIDEVRVYNRALSADEIASLYKTSYSLVNKTPIDIVKSGLVGYWPLDGKYMSWGTGVVDDVSENGDHGLIVGLSTTTSSVIGKVGQGLKFDGIDDEITVGNIADALGEMSVAVWFKLAGSLYPPYRPLVVKMDNPTTAAGWGLFIGDLSPYDKVTFLTQDSGGAHWNQYTTTTGYADGLWHHAVATLTGGINGVITIYIDGVSVPLVNGGSGTVTSNTTTDPVRIGGNPNRRFDGSLDEPRIYNRALSASEVLTLYNTTK